MKTTNLRNPFAPFARIFSRRGRALREAFSLVEVTLALGVVTFAMVGVVGVMPTALSTGRQSFDQNRAATIANTLFTSFRSQPFDNVGYLDKQFDANGVRDLSVKGLDLNRLTSVSPTDQSNDAEMYAWFTENASDAGADSFGAQRHLCFSYKTPHEVRKEEIPTGGTRYVVTLHFNNQPGGMMIKPDPDKGIPAQANQIEVTISPMAQPADKYRFISTVASRF